MSLYAPADRPRLMELIGQMHRRGERYLRLKFGLPILQGRSPTPSIARSSMPLVARDIEQAQTLVARHLLGTGDLLYRFLADAESLAQAEATSRRNAARALRQTSRTTHTTSPETEPMNSSTPADALTARRNWTTRRDEKNAAPRS